MESNYQAAFSILMAYWKCIPESERELVKQQLKIALGDSYPFYSEQNSPSKALSQVTLNIPKDCIKDALKGLKADLGFGIPDK